MTRLPRVTALALLACVAVSAAHARERPSLAEALQSPACRADVNFLCGEYVAEPDKMQACLAKNRGELSPACLQTMTSRERRFFASRREDARPRQANADDNAPPGPAQLGLPKDWSLQAPDRQQSGQRYVSPEGDASATFDQKDAGTEPFEARLKAFGFVDGADIRFLRATRNWMVVGAVKGDTAFYRRATLACDANIWRQVAFAYPVSAEAKMGRTLFAVDQRFDRIAKRSCAR